MMRKKKKKKEKKREKGSAWFVHCPSSSYLPTCLPACLPACLYSSETCYDLWWKGGGVDRV